MCRCSLHSCSNRTKGGNFQIGWFYERGYSCEKDLEWNMFLVYVNRKIFTFDPSILSFLFSRIGHM